MLLLSVDYVCSDVGGECERH